MAVEPLIEPEILTEPADVVTVQSPVCAEGFDRTELMTTCFVEILELLIVCGSESNALAETTTVRSLLVNSFKVPFVVSSTTRYLSDAVDAVL